MRVTHAPRAPAEVVLALAFLVIGAIASIAFAAPAREAPPAAPAIATPPPPEVRDTGANLQTAFAAEVNAKEFYVQAAKQAEGEGMKPLARLFRACARAEQVHADRHVQAIAWTTAGEAKALLKPPQPGVAVDLLQRAIAQEEYEIEHFYPPLLAQARAEGRTMAVRSLTFALSAEREHARLLREALASLGQQAQADHVWFVCPYCGKTVATLGFRKCPNCFTSAGRFIRVT
jgi:rubrerythrin